MKSSGSRQRRMAKGFGGEGPARGSDSAEQSKLAVPATDEPTVMVLGRPWWRITKLILLAYVIYAISSGFLFFAVQERSAAEFLRNSDPERFFGPTDAEGIDRAAMIENGEDAIRARLQLIHSAETSIDVSYHTLHAGTTADVFFASILEAADRGVSVRILMDGMLHRLIGSMRDVRYVLQLHPNVEYRFYEPFNLLQPWTWNNRLHDKLLIVDKEKAIISGRNMGNRYYLPGYIAGETAQDRDVMVLNTKPEARQYSAVVQMIAYFDYLWNHPFTARPDLALNQRRRDAAAAMRATLDRNLTTARQQYPQYFVTEIAWEEFCVPTRRITLIHNPLQRGNKAPWVWAEMARLAGRAKESAVVQSPYVIPTSSMMAYLDVEHLQSIDLTVITNSVATSPNMPAIAGYMRVRPEIKRYARQLWEYHGSGSIHGKAMVVDHDLSVVGSFNIDARSAFLSTETMLVIHGEEFNQLLRQSLDAIKEQSQPLLQPGITAGSYPQQAEHWSKSLAVALLRPLSRWFSHML